VLSIDRRSLQHFDWLLLGLVAAILGVGLANLYSATLPGSATALPSEFRRQLLALVLGGAGLALALAVDYRRLERLAFPLYAASLLLLASTLVLAPVTRGSRSWLIFGPFSLQPAELAKIGLVLALARHFHESPPAEIRRVRDLLPAAAIAAAPVLLIVLQRDMGVAVLTLAVAATYLLFTRIPARAWGGMAAAGVAGLAALWRFVFQDYQRQRILDFLDPSRDPLASGYQAIQSRIAIGSGGVLGKGWLDGTQTQLQFLPTQHSDFIFSVLAEEWGFVGCTLLLGLYLALLLWGLRVAAHSKDGFGAMLAVGVVGMLFWPAAINVAMVLGLAPVIGVPLPLLSYGGSQLMANLVALGLLMNVSMRRYMF
jgi:rod shape determining protein RodA